MSDLVGKLNFISREIELSSEHKRVISDAADRIEDLEKELRRLIDYGMETHHDLNRARAVLGVEADYAQ